ncbi:MAG TPA: hypothetical protein VFQ27_07645 [Xanthobacteraceae bacterium]|nr:hypothetical protein [Xanthobacteraceae bacterium]
MTTNLAAAVRKVAAPAALMLAAACSSIGGTTSSTTTGEARSFTDRFADTLFGGPAPSETASAPQDDFYCPVVDVRQGASTLVIHGKGDPVATNVRYQGTIGDYARECARAGSALNIKVGVRGRVILGPVGEPGSLEVPLRIALVQEGPEPKTLWTKLYRMPVTIPPGETDGSFMQVEENLSVPMPSAADLASYIIYVGFDQQGVKEKPQRRQRRQRG